MRVPARIPKSELSDIELINEYKHPVKYSKIKLYDVMALRSRDSKEILDLLISAIVDDCNRQEIIMGVIRHSWIPAISLLEYGSDREVELLKDAIENWDVTEVESFKDYVSSSKSLSDRIF